jgi:hypothetical protein
VGVGVLDYRRDERFAAANVGRGPVRTLVDDGITARPALRTHEAVSSFLDVPAVVPALRDDVHLLVVELADVTDEQVPPLEAHSPRVAKAPRELLVEALLADQRVVVGDPVGLAVLPAVDVDPEDAPEEVLVDVLAVPAAVLVPVADVPLDQEAAAAVAHPHVEVAVLGAEQDLARVVGVVRRRDLEDGVFGVGNPHGEVLGRAELREYLGVGVPLWSPRPRRRAVVEVELPVLAVVRVEGEPEQPALVDHLFVGEVVEVHEPVPDVDERLQPTPIERVDPADLVHHEPTIAFRGDFERERGGHATVDDGFEPDRRSPRHEPLRRRIVGRRLGRRRGLGARLPGKPDGPAHRALVVLAVVFGYRLGRSEVDRQGRPLGGGGVGARDRAPVGVEDHEVVWFPVDVRPRDLVSLAGRETEIGVGLARDRLRAPTDPAGDRAVERESRRCLSPGNAARSECGRRHGGSEEPPPGQQRVDGGRGRSSRHGRTWTQSGLSVTTPARAAGATDTRSGVGDRRDWFPVAADPVPPAYRNDARRPPS